MRKAVFFSGPGTVYAPRCVGEKVGELYPATLPALRFLGRRGYCLVLLTPEFREYQWLRANLAEKTLPLLYWNGQKRDLGVFLQKNNLDLKRSYYVTDNCQVTELLFLPWQTILVLTGRGIATLQKLSVVELQRVVDLCKDVYAAAISIAILAEKKEKGFPKISRIRLRSKE